MVTNMTVKNMTFQPDSSSSASVLSLKHRGKSSLLLFHFQARSSRRSHVSGQKPSTSTLVYPFPPWKVVEMQNNYCVGKKSTIFYRYTNFSHNRTGVLWSKIHLAEKGEVRIQMKRSAIHWTCDEEQWIGGNSQNGATSRCISSAKIYRARRYLSIFL